MRETEVVEVGSSRTAERSRRLLSAVRSGSFEALARELALARSFCRTPLPECVKSTLAEEQTELLGAIVERLATSGYTLSIEPEISLLGHLAGAC
jgi:hypothetical protein